MIVLETEASQSRTGDGDGANHKDVSLQDRILGEEQSNASDAHTGQHARERRNDPPEASGDSKHPPSHEEPRHNASQTAN